MESHKEIAKGIRLAGWADVMRARKQSGLSIRGWCRENGVKEKTYYYWQRKLREEAWEGIAAEEQGGIQVSPSRFTQIKMREPESQPSMGTALAVPEMGLAEVEGAATAPVTRDAAAEANVMRPASELPEAAHELRIEMKGMRFIAGSEYPAERLAALPRELAQP